MKLEHLDHCPICDNPFGPAAKTVLAGDPFRVTREQFTLVRCTACRTYVLNPRPPMSEMGVYYDSQFLTDTSKTGTSLIARLAAKQQQWNLVSEVRWLAKHLDRGARYLDYSGGNGQIVGRIKARRPDIEVHATEFSDDYRHSIAGFIGTDRVRRELDDFPPDARFDLISAFGVLEHVEDPRQMLRSISGRLADGGKVMLSVPNVCSWQKQIMGRHWYSWVAPRHWHMMPMARLKQLLAENGFRVVDEKHFFLRTSSATLVVSLFPWLDPLLHKSAWKTVLYGLLFYALIPFEYVAAAFGRAGFMGVVAEKIGPAESGRLKKSA